MAFWKRTSTPTDRITADALAEFGRFAFLGAEQSGVSDSYSLISPLVPLSYPAEGPGYMELVAELRRHAERGEWEKVGAWKYVRDFLSDTPDVADLIDGGLLAIARMRVTNLAIHLAPIDSPRYIQLTGGPPPNDGFFGPPVFDSHYGPTRQYYFDHAITAAASRQITRLVSVPGAAPGPVDGAARCMWDFGLVIYRGPLLVSSDIAFEPNVVRPAVAAANGTDHALFAERLVEAVLDRRSSTYGPWASIGAARFIEDYLDPTTAESAACERAIDDGLAQLREGRLIGVAMSPELFTPRQQARLAASGS